MEKEKFYIVTIFSHISFIEPKLLTVHLRLARGPLLALARVGHVEISVGHAGEEVVDLNISRVNYF